MFFPCFSTHEYPESEWADVWISEVLIASSFMNQWKSLRGRTAEEVQERLAACIHALMPADAGAFTPPGAAWIDRFTREQAPHVLRAVEREPEDQKAWTKGGLFHTDEVMLMACGRRSALFRERMQAWSHLADAKVLPEKEKPKPKRPKK